MKSKAIILALGASFLLSACGTVNGSVDLGQTAQLNATILQTLSPNAALAETKGDKPIIVEITTQEDMYYDGKEVSGMYILYDTYTYEGKNHVMKTVPVYMKKSEYKKLNQK